MYISFMVLNTPLNVRMLLKHHSTTVSTIGLNVKAESFLLSLLMQITAVSESMII